MGDVVSIFQKKKKVEEPSIYIEGYLKESLASVNFETVSGFTKTWDVDANLWRLEVLVKQPLSQPKQMAFWYDGEEPQYAAEAPVGQPFDYRTAERVVKAHENG